METKSLEITLVENGWIVNQPFDRQMAQTPRRVFTNFEDLAAHLKAELVPVDPIEKAPMAAKKAKK